MTGNVICHDWEFYENGRTIEPISVALVADNGEEYYAIFDNATYTAKKSRWLFDNVFPHLQSDLLSKTDIIKSKDTIVKEITEFIRDRTDPELWAWYGAYDHVALAQTLGGPMISLPDGIPMFTNDLKTLQILTACYRNLPNQDPKTCHHALYDARHDMELYNFFMEAM